MPTIRLATQKEVDQWKNVLKSLEILIEIADQEEKAVQDFYHHTLESIHFWHRYASDKTDDLRLKRYVENEREVVGKYGSITQPIALTQFKKFHEWLKGFTVTTE